MNEEWRRAIEEEVERYVAEALAHRTARHGGDETQRVLTFVAWRWYQARGKKAVPELTLKLVHGCTIVTLQRHDVLSNRDPAVRVVSRVNRADAHLWIGHAFRLENPSD